MSILSSGNVGIGTTNPLQKLHVYRSTDGAPVRFEDSNGYCEIDPTSTSWTCTSDIRLKKDISPIASSDALQSLLDLQGVDFRWNREGIATPTHSGFVAQAVEKVLPEMVRTDSTTGLKSVAYGAFTPLIVEGIKQQQSEITSLKTALTYITDTVLPANFSRTREILTTETSEIINAKLAENGQIVGEMGEKLNTVDEALKALQKQVEDLQAVILANAGIQGLDSGSSAGMTQGQASMTGDNGLTTTLVTAEGTIPAFSDYGMGSEASSSAGMTNNELGITNEASSSAVLGEASSSSYPSSEATSSAVIASGAWQSEIAEPVPSASEGSSPSATPRNDEASPSAVILANAGIQGLDASSSAGMTEASSSAVVKDSPSYPSSEATISARSSEVLSATGGSNGTVVGDVKLNTFNNIAVREGLKVFGALSVFGQSSFANTNIAGTLTIDSVIITESGLSAYGKLELQPFAQGTIELMAGSVSVNEYGDVVIRSGNLVLEAGQIFGNGSMRGALALTTGATFGVVPQSWKTAPKSVVLTPGFNTKAWVENLGANGFVIHVDSAPSATQEVYWLAVW